MDIPVETNRSLIIRQKGAFWNIEFDNEYDEVMDALNSRRFFASQSKVVSRSGDR